MDYNHCAHHIPNRLAEENAELKAEASGDAVDRRQLVAWSSSQLKTRRRRRSEAVDRYKKNVISSAVEI